MVRSCDNPCLKVVCKMLLAKLAPTKVPIFALRYKPVLAMAICDSSIPAARPTKVVDSTIPAPKPPGAINSDSHISVLPLHKRIRRR